MADPGEGLPPPPPPLIFSETAYFLNLPKLPSQNSTFIFKPSKAPSPRLLLGEGLDPPLCGIHWMNHYPVESVVCFLNTFIHWIAIYMVGSVVHPLNNRALLKNRRFKIKSPVFSGATQHCIVVKKNVM